MCSASDKDNNGWRSRHKHRHKNKHKHKYKRIKTSTPGQHSRIKWKILLTSIILLLCRTSHVLAIRKGRLMSPSSFVALSGDLHVQIQFTGEDASDVGVLQESPATPTTTSTTTARTPRPQTAQQQPAGGNVENIITSTLVISKFIDEYYPAPDHKANASVITTSTLATTTTHSISNSTASTNQDQLLHRKRKEIVQNIPLFPDPRHNVTQIAVPCQTFTSGGLYEMQVVTNLKTTTLVGNHSNFTATTTEGQLSRTITTTTLMPASDERLRQTLDVRWPSAEMIVSPVRLRTYPDSPVEVTLRFPEVNCDKAWRSENLPEFWLELVYCGKERTCSQLMPQNTSKSSILYAEQVRGFPKHKTVKLKCELFGLAGNYAVQLRPMMPAPNVPLTRRFLSVDWSDKFVFNVYARSIFPCDPHTGIGVLYEYPACILDQGDRVRVYAKLRADVASLKPPTTLHYVAEQRVVKSQYSLYFNCDLFTEKYVEYCFVYVSQAISGAVADVRMDCVPTLPVSDSDTGGWGPWSEWTPCSTNCLGGTRNRYRFCDSPPPRYGAKFCEGHSVQTEKCGKSIADTWDCIYETSGTNLSKSNRTEVNQEIGPGCRCGCIVHLGSSKPKRIIAGATQSCPGRSFWLIQVDGAENIALSLNFLQLPCPSQYIKVRDGPSLSSTLLIELNGGSNLNMPALMQSTGAQLLVEFYAGDETLALNGSSASAACTGGFLSGVEQVVPNATSTFLSASSTRYSVKSRAVMQKPKLRSGFTAVHLSAVVFASIIILISALLGAQYVVRYRKYHLAVARRHDEGSRLHTPHASMSSLHSPPSRALSTTTLISEVIYLVKMRPKHQLRHSILRESVDAENLARETDFSEPGLRQQTSNCDMSSPQKEETHPGDGADTPTPLPSVKCLIDKHEKKIKTAAVHAPAYRTDVRSRVLQGQLSTTSIMVGNNGVELEALHEASSEVELVPLMSDTWCAAVKAHRLNGSKTSLVCKLDAHHSMQKRNKSEEELGSTGSVLTLRNETIDPIIETSIHSVTDEDPTDGASAHSATLANTCCSKDAESIDSSGLCSIYNSPRMSLKRQSKYSDYYDAATLQVRNSGVDDSTTDCDSLRSASMRDYERLNQLQSRSASATLINGCYSPATSVVSTATIRTTNAKESKEQQNRKKLLARPGSEFSLGNQEELEMDYYDYNVINAAAAPGSYLGMDPAHLLWIPPLADITDGHDGDKTPEPIIHELDETEPLYEGINMPKIADYLSPGSNTESSCTTTTNNTTPTSDELSPLNSYTQSKATTPSDTNLKNCLIQKTISNCSNLCKAPTSRITRLQGGSELRSKSALSLGAARSGIENIPLYELTGTKSARNFTRNTVTHLVEPSSSAASLDAMNESYVEKETSVVKSPSDLQNFLALDDLQFADEGECDLEVAAIKAQSEEQTEGTKTGSSVLNKSDAPLKDLSA